MIREYFEERFKSEKSQAWQLANQALYHHYRKTVKIEQPDNLDAMQPLLYAVKHGCLANLHQQAFDEVYISRIARYKDYYLHKIGACSDDLMVLSSFIEESWKTVNANLNRKDQALILRTIAHRLRSLGWIAECIEPFNTAVDIYRQLGDKGKTAKTESDLIEPYLTLGDINAALKLAESGVKQAYNDDPDPERRLRRLSVYARALHQSGDKDMAYHYYKEAERIQPQVKAGIQYLIGLSGFRYCELLMEDNKDEEALQHANCGLNLALEQQDNNKPYKLFIGLNKLIIGRILIKQGKLKEAETTVLAALKILREANDQDHLPRALLTCTSLRRYQKQFSEAHQRLKEVLDIANPNSMRLHIVDCHIEYVKLYLAEGKRKEAMEHFEEAKTMIQEMGYHRRDKELNELKARLTLPPFNGAV